MNAYQTAYEYLSADPVSHTDMLAVLTEADAEILYAWGDGVVLFFDDIHFISARSDDVALRLLPLLSGSGSGCIVSHNPVLLAPLCDLHGCRLLMHCHNYVYTQTAPPTCTLPAGTSIRPLTPNDLPIVLENYHGVSDSDYVEERLRAGMFGITLNGALAGFIGTHTERSMGMLAVLPPYRGLGLGYALEAFFVGHLLKSNRTVFAQVASGNTASEKLQQKLGLVTGSHRVDWIGKPTPLA